MIIVLLDSQKSGMRIALLHPEQTIQERKRREMEYREGSRTWSEVPGNMPPLPLKGNPVSGLPLPPAVREREYGSLQQPATGVMATPPAAENEAERFPVLGVKISSWTREEFFRLLERKIAAEDPDAPPCFVVTVNPEIAVHSIIDPQFREILGRSTINTADGIGIRWAVRFLYGREVERITGSDSLEEICRIGALHNRSVFFYGAMPGVAQKAAGILEKRIKNLDVAGTWSPERADLPFEELPAAVREQLCRASVIFVGLGAPAQEKWIDRNLPHLKSCKVIIGIGGTFDFIAGNVKRAPLLFRRIGMEWAYRLCRQPSRWRRMMKLPLFAFNVILLRGSCRDLAPTANS